MSSYIIRLDDACPTMNHSNWDTMEEILDYYGVKPIVGIIPDNTDPTFSWEEDAHFWDKALIWQKKGWIPALHGLHHKYHTVPHGSCFQMTLSTWSKFIGLSVEEQKKMITEGLDILHGHGIMPTCFFAPAHTYDANTVLALRESGSEIKFISDGYKLYPYRKNGMVFVPSICDGPFHMPFGIYTYVFHPSYMDERGFERLKAFLDKEGGNVITAESCLGKIRSSQGLGGRILEYGIYIARGIRDKIKYGNDINY